MTESPVGSRAVARSGVWPVAVLAIALASPLVAHSAEQTWAVTTGTWTIGSSWVSGTAPANSATTDTAYFSSTSANVVASLAASQSVAGITFGATGSTTINNTSGANQILTIGTSGITLNSGAGAVIVGSTSANQWVRMAVSGSQTWTNNSSSLFTLNNRLRLPSGSGLTLKGSGDWLFGAIENSNGQSSGNSGSMVVDIGGKATINASVEWTGGMTITSGTVAYLVPTALGSGSNTVTIENGWLEATNATVGNRNLVAQMVWKGNVGFGGANTLSANSSAVTLAANSNVTTTGGTVTIGSATTAIGESGGSFGFTKLGSSTLVLDGANTYSGTTRINAGTLRLGANGSFANSPFIAVGGTTGASGAVLDLTAKTGSFTFLSTQTVGGIGTVNIGAGKTVAVAGAWAPGNSIGSNAVTGNLALSGSSVFELGTPGSSTLAPGTSDFTAVSGTLTLGGTLDLRDNAGAGGLGSAAGGVYRLFTYGSAVSGSYATVTAPSAATRVGPGNVSLVGSGTAAGQGVFVTVYNKAAPNTLSGTVNLGTVLANTTLAQALTIVNNAPANGFSESLNASFGSLVSATASGSITQLAAGGTNASSMLVGLDATTAGIKTGSATLNFATDGAGTSGLGPLSLASQTVSLSGTVLDPGRSSFASGSTSTALLVSLGQIGVGGTASQSFNIYNLLQTAGFTADLALVDIVPDVDNSGSIYTDLATFTDLAAGDFLTFTATLDGATSGGFSNEWTLTFKSATADTVYSSDTPQTMTLTVTGLVVVPEPETAVLAVVGVGLAAWRFRRRRNRL